MKNILFILIAVVIAAHAQAQIVRQPGQVRKISYNPKEQVVPVADVRLKVENEVRSDQNGLFTLEFTPGRDNTFVFDQIRKPGYTLISPAIEELKSRRYQVTKTPTEIILAKNDELDDERRRIERDIRKQKEKEIEEKDAEIARKDAELAAMRENTVQYQKLRADRDSLAHE